MKNIYMVKLDKDIGLVAWILTDGKLIHVERHGEAEKRTRAGDIRIHSMGLGTHIFYSDINKEQFKTIQGLEKEYGFVFRETM